MGERCSPLPFKVLLAGLIKSAQEIDKRRSRGFITYACMELHIHKRLRNGKVTEVYVRFRAKDEARHLGASEGRKVIYRLIRRADVQ